MGQPAEVAAQPAGVLAVGDRGHRVGGQRRIGEQAGRPADHDLVHPGTPGLAVVGGRCRYRGHQLVQPGRAARTDERQQRGVHGRRVAQPGRDRGRLPGLDLGDRRAEGTAGRGIESSDWRT